MNPEVIIAAAMSLSAAHAERVEDVRPVVDLRAVLTPKQLAFVQDESPVTAYLAGRRHGKSVALAVKLLMSVMGKPRGRSLYLTLTQKNSRLMFLPVLRQAAEMLGLALKVNAVMLVVQVHGGGEIILGGCDDLSEAQKWRGYAWELAILDECGAVAPKIFSYLYDDVLEPSTLDFGGQLGFAGTPGPTLAGGWFDMTGPQSKAAVPVHRGTIYDNPHISDVEAKLAAIRERRGWSETHPTFLREYLGQWVQDESALVYPYDPTRNGLACLPTLTSTGVPLDGQWRHVIIVDVGYAHAAAFTVMAAHPMLRDDYVLRSYKRRGWLVHQYAEELRRLRQDFPRARIVMDTGGMGKQHAEELTRRFALPIEAADKREKKSAIQVTRDRLIAGRLKILDTPDNDDIRDEAAVLGWDDKHEQHHPDQDDHCWDTVLYGMRALYHYTQEEPKPGPEPGSEEWLEREQERMFQAQIKRVQARKQKRRWM